METLELRVQDDLTIVVPKMLGCITTYVLLEQEDWFEKEITFIRRWLRSGMTAIDVGANLGVYSLLMARLVAPKGRVFAYEPGSEARGYLEQSRDLNALANLDILPFALSDRKQDGYLVFGTTIEANALGSAGRGGEAVRVTSLDVEDRVRQWRSPDFLKIDAEGAEEQIISGGRNFLRMYSPLVMFEVAVGKERNEKLVTLLPEINYRVYRALPEAPILVPLDPDEVLDSRELNLFAAKADRAESLSTDGFLVQSIPNWEPDEDAQSTIPLELKGLAFASGFPLLFNDTIALHPAYRLSLAAYAVWSDPNRSAPARCAALQFAFTTLTSLCSQEPSAARLSTLARIAWDWGKQDDCIKALIPILNEARAKRLQIAEPFLPASHRFDVIALRGDPESWFIASAAELYERVYNFSSLFAGATPVTNWLCNQPYATPGMMRRRLLIEARAGHQPKVPATLEIQSSENLNASIWRARKVPGVSII